MKTPRECQQGGLVLTRQRPGLPGIATQKKQAYLGFQCLDHPHYSPDLAPFPGIKKPIESSPFFF